MIKNPPQKYGLSAAPDEKLIAVIKWYSELKGDLLQVEWFGRWMSKFEEIRVGKVQ